MFFCADVRTADLLIKLFDSSVDITLTTIGCLGRKRQLLYLFEASCMHIYDTFCMQLLLTGIWRSLTRGSFRRCCDTLRESNLTSINEIPTLILFIVLRVQTLLAKIAEVVGSDMGLRAIVWNYIFLQ